MPENHKLTLIGMVAGIILPANIEELHLYKSRIFRNPAVTGNPGDLPEFRENTSLYSGEGSDRHFDRDVASYLIEMEVDALDGRFENIRIQGSGSVLAGTSREGGGVTLSTGTEPNSSAVISGPMDDAKNSPSLVTDPFQESVLPLRILTKGRILIYPIGILSNQARDEMVKTGVFHECPTIRGTSVGVTLTSNDCEIITAFAGKLAKANLENFETPLFLFSRSYGKADVADRALDLIIAIESLLSNSSESIGYKIAFRAACMTAIGEAQRWDIFQFTKLIYNLRSDLVHGNKRKLNKARIQLGQDIEKIENLARNCLALACLLQIDTIKLPSGKTASMNKEETIDEYILTQILPGEIPPPLADLPVVGKYWTLTHVV